MPFIDDYPYTNLHNVNLDWVLRRVKEWGELVEQNDQNFKDLKEANEAFKEYVTTYLQNLDVQEEINIKLDDLLESGELQEYIAPYIASDVEGWLNTHIEPTTPPVDDTLSIRGAAADSKTVGDRFEEVQEEIDKFDPIKENILSAVRSVVWITPNDGCTYEQLCSAMFPGDVPRTLDISLSVSFVEVGTTYAQLRELMTVTAYFGNVPRVITDYVLYGDALVPGTNRIVCAYHGRAVPFTVLVSDVAPTESIIIDGYSAANVDGANMSVSPFYLPNRFYNYDYPVTITKMKINVRAAGVFTIGHQAENTIPAVGASVNKDTLLQNFVVDNVITFTSTGVQEVNLPQPIVLQSGDCIAVCKPTDSCNFNYGTNGASKGFWYTRDKVYEQSTHSLGMTFWARD